MRRLFSQFWALCGPYWRSQERWKSGLLLLAIIGLSLGSVYITVLINLWYALFYNSLQDKDFSAFSYQLLRFAVLAGVYIFAAVYQIYLRQMLQIRWRNWLTQRYAGMWLQKDAYYRMQLSCGGSDNPDQRIAEDINIFVSQTLILGLGVLESVVSLGSFAVILWGLSGTLTVAGLSIPGYMLWAALIYAIVGTWLANVIGRPLISLNFQQQQYEANLRFALVRLRENAEGIALYGGEKAELDTVNSKFSQVVSNWWGIMRRQKLLTWFSSGYSQIAIIFPFIVAAPRYFSGAFQLGQLMQTAQAFGQVQSSLSWFVTNYTSIAEWKATVNRLSSFEESISQNVSGSQGLVRTEMPEAEGFSIRAANIYLPDGSALLTDLSFQFPPASRVLVTGPSGSGKSTFLRTLCGIWPYCDGGISVPVGEKVMFLPQKPYLPLGPLRNVVCYPDAASVHSEEEIRSVLSVTGLGAFIGRLDEGANWALHLSPGEQQRIAFARALLLRPHWLFLDEATCALDEDSEAELYALVLERIRHCAIISVAHRKSLAHFHDRHIAFSRKPGVKRTLVTEVHYGAQPGMGALPA
ncbi:MAG: ABC transporter ATP-binding protein/permease [Rhodomicrobium sp.]